MHTAYGLMTIRDSPADLGPRSLAHGAKNGAIACTRSLTITIQANSALGLQCSPGCELPSQELHGV